jgi:hypothetical protein
LRTAPLARRVLGAGQLPAIGPATDPRLSKHSWLNRTEPCLVYRLGLQLTQGVCLRLAGNLDYRLPISQGTARAWPTAYH